MSDLWTAFEQRADANPLAPALIFQDGKTSFGELKTLALRYAASLAKRGVCHGDVIGLQLPKRRGTYALLLGCLKLGAPYVFIDPKNPPDRTARIVDRLHPKILFTAAKATNPHGETISLSENENESWLAGSGSIDTTSPRVVGTDPAYIMFTSGTTGEPKGAVIPHQGVLSLMAWAREAVHKDTQERFTSINPLHFDNSVFDIYCGLLNGAALVPVETSETSNPAAWVRMVRSGKATIMFAVPTLFLILDQLGLLTPEALPDVHTFQFGGEGYPIEKLRDFQARFAGRARLINVYGPTETSCICSSVEITPNNLTAPDNEFPPLGQMHRNFSYTILDEERRPVTRGDSGELWIGGPCVGLDYYANPEETAARFCQDPRQNRYRSIFYRSGDLVREDESGQLWFQGRVDNQVKIRGHRIELEEVDLAVQSVPDVRRAVSVVLAGKDGNEIAVAYIADRKIGSDEILASCRDTLPAYMRPSQVVQFEDLPRNANGKIDRKAAKELLQQASAT
jgi:D-alanine--poly(phosphoribitol) ligase subunit 1